MAKLLKNRNIYSKFDNTANVFVADTFLGDCYVLSMGVHYEQDTMGSRRQTNK